MMMNFNFSVSTQIQFGAGASRQAGAVTKSPMVVNGSALAGDVLVIVDPGIRRASWLNHILESLDENDLHYQIFDKVMPNPRDENVDQAASLIREKNLGVIIAIGGGSTIDTAKSASLLATHGGKISDYAGWAKVPGPILPVVAIPTTAGSGSEATCWAVITDTAGHAKLAIGDRYIAPLVALVDPLLTISLPSAVTAATGMDVLTHAIEAYLCVLSSPVNDLLALESIRLVAAHLLRAVTDGEDQSAREAMMLASTLGGIAINNADVAGVHCLTEGIGSLYDAPHGLLNAILLPYFMYFWQAGCSERFARIAEAFGVDPRPEEAVTQIRKLTKSLKFPSLEGIGVKKTDLAKLAELAESNVSNPSNPVPMKASDYQAILERAMEGHLSQVG
jgi:alcohol dehydrogenase class IV